MKSAVPPLLILRLLCYPAAWLKLYWQTDNFPGDLGKKRNQLGELTGAWGQFIALAKFFYVSSFKDFIPRVQDVDVTETQIPLVTCIPWPCSSQEGISHWALL